jgi:dTMP kinase
MVTPGGGPEPVFIDFEGIDGSGKTTLSNRLADYLKKQGIPVHHARDRGVFRSEISRAIRDLTRDPRFLRMTDVTELLLYVARDAQMIEEFIRPKLLPGHVVFSDRYLYSTISHSHHGRGIDRAAVESVINLAAGGLWPDLVVYCDVDPLTSRIRKKIQKIRERRLSDFGRKGLMGIGFREQMREGFLQLAAEDSERWMVVDNVGSTIEESLDRIFRRVAAILKRKGFGEIPGPRWVLTAPAHATRGKKPGSNHRPGVNGEPVQASAPAEEVRNVQPGHANANGLRGGGEPLAARIRALDGMPEAERREEAVRVFFNELWRLAPSRPGYSGLFLVGLDSGDAHELREELIPTEPALVAYGLRGLLSDPSMNFRDRLKETEPVYVARSLCGLQLHPRAIALRREMATVAPEQVALALQGNPTEEAWELRDLLRKHAQNEVLISLRGLDSERAWEIREKKTKEKHYPALLESLGGIDSDVAWAWRERLAEEYLPWALLSLRQVFGERAWRWREEHIARAPKIVIKTLGRSDDPRAWDLRDRAKLLAKEVLDSISGLDSGQAWNLRLALQDKWPNTTVSSLGAGNQSERAWKFRWEQLGRNPDNLLLLKHVVKAVFRASMAGEDAEEEDGLDDELT